jgi:predicted adenylyl cyclase CyaB
MKNIELKITLAEPKSILSKLKFIKARFAGKLSQVDTYYNCQNGLLKIREINGKNFELIFYKRPNTKKSKISDYQVLPLDKSQLAKTKYILNGAFGEKVIVKKKRSLWLYKNTRIHIDKVNNLGSYLELETVVKKSIADAKKEHQQLIKKLDIENAKKVDISYSDLLN